MPPAALLSTNPDSVGSQAGGLLGKKERLFPYPVLSPSLQNGTIQICKESEVEVIKAPAVSSFLFPIAPLSQSTSNLLNHQCKSAMLCADRSGWLGPWN